MAHLPTKEADDQRVFRIARELGISLEDAAVTCAGFERAFSDDSLRREIFEIIERLDYEAAKKGEPLGLILSYTVELERDGIRVGRYADKIPSGQVVNLTPTDRAMIFLRIKDNFPTQQFLGPIIMNRPEWEFESEDQCRAEQDDLISNVKLPSLAQEGWRPIPADGVVYSDKSQIPNPKSQIEWRGGSSPDINKLPSLAKEGWHRSGLTGWFVPTNPRSKIQNPKSIGVVVRAGHQQAPLLGEGGVPGRRGGLSPDTNRKIKELEIPNTFSPSRSTEAFIWDIPTRLTLDERFPFLSATASKARRGFFLRSADRTALKPPHHLPPWAALQAKMPAFQWTSGLSPPLNAENLGHSKSKRCPDRPPAITQIETRVSHMAL